MNAPTTHKKRSFLNFFPVPEYLLLSNSGISVGERDVRFVQFHGTGARQELALAHCGRTELPPGVIQNGEIQNPDALTNVLGELRDKYHVNHTSATLPDDKAYLFTTHIDKVAREDMRDAVAFIIEENVPVSLSESVFDFEVVPRQEDDGQLHVAVSVVSTRVIEAYISAYANAGISIISFDIESQAIARAVVPRGDTRTHLVLNLERDRTNFYIVESEVVQFSSTSLMGVASSAESEMNDLKAEFRKLIAFWNTRMESENLLDKQIQKILITGSEAHQEQFVQQLLGETDIEHAPANVWVNAFSLENKQPDIPFNESLGYAATVGLALPHKPQSYV